MASHADVCVFHELATKTMDDHEERIRALEIEKADLFARMDTVCTQLANVTKVLAWVAGAVITGSVGMVFYQIMCHMNK